MSAEEQLKIDKLLSRFIYGFKQPFSIVENEEFRALLNYLKPGYRIPCRASVGSKLLDTCYEEVKKEQRSEKKETATLLVDGWQNDSAGKKLFVTMAKIRSTQKEVVISSYDLSAERCDHNTLRECIVDSVDKADKDFNLEIDSVASDHESATLKAARECNLIQYGCEAHAGNLFCKNVLDPILYEQVHLIMVTFKSVKCQGIIRSEGGSSIATRGKTR